MTYYDEMAQGYDELHREEQEKKIALIKKDLSIMKEMNLLDVGCGSGISTRTWPCNRTGIDPSKELIEKAKKADPEGTYLVGSGEKLPFEDKSFDVVTCITALHNFDDPMDGLKEIKRVGKGMFIFSVLKKAKDFSRLSQAILFNFPIKRIKKEEKDIIFLAI